MTMVSLARFPCRRAIRLATALRVDGELDEPVYETVAPVSDFIQ